MALRSPLVTISGRTRELAVGDVLPGVLGYVVQAATPTGESYGRASLMDGDRWFNSGNGIEYTYRSGTWAADAGSSPPAWGSITGTLSNQADLNSALSAKADTSALNSLSSTVTQQGNTLTSQGQEITNVQASINVNQNLIPNPTGADGFNGWGTAGTSSQFATIADELYGKYGKIFRFGPLPASTSVDVGIGLPTDRYIILPTSPGRSFTVSGDMYWHTDAGNAAPYIQIRWYGSSGAELDISTRVQVNATTRGWKRYSGTFTAPTGAEKATVIARLSTTTGTASSYFGIANLKFENGTVATLFTDDATQAAQSQATTALTSRVTTAEGRLDSQSTQVTSLQNSLTTTNNNVTAAQNTANNALSVANTKADSSVVQALDSRVTSVEGVNTSQGNSITSLNNSLTTVTNDVNGLKTSKADASALNSLSTTVTQQGQDITSANSRIDTKASLSGATFTGGVTIQNAARIRMEGEDNTIEFYDTDGGITTYLNHNSQQFGFLQNNAFAWAAYRTPGNDWACVNNIISYASDERLKDGIVPVSRSRLDSFFDAFKVVEFDWNDEKIAVMNPGFNYDSKHEVGGIAQWAETMAPTMVHTHTHNGIKTIKWDKAVPYLIAEVQSLRTRLASLEERL